MRNSKQLTTVQRRKILERDGYKCQQCGLKGTLGKKPGTLQVHHVIYQESGGDNSPKNLTTLCYDCHRDQHGKKGGLRRIARRHLSEPGGVKLSNCKVSITLYLDADVLEYFKNRAAQPHAAPYQTQINHELRALMEGNARAAHQSLVDDEQFIAAVAERVKERTARRPGRIRRTASKKSRERSL